MTEIRFDLPWPHRALSPNSRVHFMVRAKHTKAARATAMNLTRAAMRRAGGAFFLHYRRIAVHLEFVAADRRRRDGSNIASQHKAAIDGIADAIGVDDSKFIVSHELSEQIAKPAAVRVTVRGIE